MNPTYERKIMNSTYNSVLEPNIVTINTNSKKIKR